MKLNDIAEFVTDKISSSSISLDRYVTTDSLLQNRRGRETAQNLPPIPCALTHYRQGDVLVANIRPYLKKVWYADSEGGCSSDVLAFRAKNGHCSSFLYTVLMQDAFFDYAMSGAKGSKMPRGDKDQIMRYELPTLTPMEEENIGNMMVDIMSKININRQINDNLEQQAQALFKSWFVDFEPFRGGEFVDSELGLIPKGWRVVSLGEVTKQITEKVGNREDVTVLSPINSGELVLSEEYFTKQVFSKDLSKYLIVNPLSFAYNPARINIGSIGLNTFDFVGCVSPVYVVFECEPNYQYFFDFFKRTAMFKDEVALRAIGGVRQSLGYNDLSLIKIIYPTSDVVVEFNNLYLKMKEVMIKNTDQNEKFISLRDSLLPKLMSGELKINEFNC